MLNFLYLLILIIIETAIYIFSPYIFKNIILFFQYNSTTYVYIVQQLLLYNFMYAFNFFTFYLHETKKINYLIHS